MLKNITHEAFIYIIYIYIKKTHAAINAESTQKNGAFIIITVLS